MAGKHAEFKRCAILMAIDQYSHHQLLNSFKEQPKSSAPRIQVAENHTHRLLTSSTLFRIIPVTVHGRNNCSIETFAFLDEGTDLNLIASELATSLGMKKIPQPQCLR